LAIVEAQFPPRVSLNFRSIISFDTSINEARSGKERRNANRAHPRRRWEARKEHLVAADYQAARNFWLACAGAWQGFRWKDWTDYESDGLQELGEGDGAETEFQLIKVYAVATPLTSYQRTITKPVAGTVNVYVDAVLQQGGGVDYTLSTSTGVITFTAPPANNAVITASFEFDVPVRFADDDLSLTIPFRYDRVNLDELALVEVLGE
jgi:uncharacterized protein (TIGR02217 family)